MAGATSAGKPFFAAAARSGSASAAAAARAQRCLVVMRGILGGWCQMAWVAFRAPWGEMLGGATHAGVGSPRRSANAADRPTPPGTRRAGGDCGRALRCVDLAGEPTPGSIDAP